MSLLPKLRRASVYLIAAMFVVAGVLHFVAPEVYLGIMPPYLPAPLLLVYLSGLAEIVLGVLVLPRKTRSLAGWGLILLLLAVFPANVHMALNAADFPDIPEWGLWLRLPMQFVMMAWVWWSTR
jgi:uncharacterized membrane protein